MSRDLSCVVSRDLSCDSACRVDSCHILYCLRICLALSSFCSLCLCHSLCVVFDVALSRICERSVLPCLVLVLSSLAIVSSLPYACLVTGCLVVLSLGHGDCCMVKIANTGMSEDQIVANVRGLSFCLRG